MDFEQKFTTFIEKDEQFRKALGIIRDNSKGKIWLIGGYVSRNLANLLYGTGEPQAADFDFVAEHICDKIIAPPSWKISNNRYGNPKLVNGKIEIDLIPLTNILSIQRRGLEPTIENWLSGAPLTIQSICYEIGSGKLIGEVGIESLVRKTAGINNKESAESSAMKKGISVSELVKRTAESFQFENRF